MELYDETAYQCSKLITRKYSTSFSLGIQTLEKSLRPAIYAIYGFVRYADEIVDTFHEYDKSALLEDFKKDTYEAIYKGISLNPVLHSFQKVVNQYEIPIPLIEAFLHSMKMDLTDVNHNENTYSEYIFGSAEVVGLMCLKVFCKGDQKEYEKLKPSAQSLGAAFQKVNFLRDLKSDFEERGRVYFPGVDFNLFQAEAKRLIEQDIQKDFDFALTGIKQLPLCSRFGVYVAYIYYMALFNKIKRLPAVKIQEERIRIPNPQKIWLLIQSYFKIKLNVV